MDAGASREVNDPMDTRERTTEGSKRGDAASSRTAPVRDGRSERGARNRRAILDAVYELVTRDERMPTAERAAEVAGVGIRTVFRHFSDMDALYAEVYGRVHQNLRTFIEVPLPDGSLEARCKTVIRRRCELFERMAAFRRAAVLQRDRSEFLHRQIEENDARLRLRLYAGFPELEGAPPALVEALDLLSSFEAWNRLKTQQGLSSFETQIALEAAFTSLMREAIQ
jgi:AcrR family transcriptional regulator